ncbi:unnamed protein product [Gongylonema pulchrum]|uniref:H15 domain-containing protein n=1 Tax=Gongylonema pulchrum TaxID=637853 RepID=A0A183CUQ3_9BILA|nr:unnamed protein product [Gongylonema pulchrum]
MGAFWNFLQESVLEGLSDKTATNQTISGSDKNKHNDMIRVRGEKRVVKREKRSMKSVMYSKAEVKNASACNPASGAAIETIKKHPWSKRAVAKALNVATRHEQSQPRCWALI